MKLYILFSGPLYPIRAMSQVRVLNQIKCLRKEHKIVFSDIVSRHESLQMAQQYLSSYEIDYKPIFSANYQKCKLIKAYSLVIRFFVSRLSAITQEELAIKAKPVRKQILHNVTSSCIDAFIIHYWYGGFLFSCLDQKILRMIDTHYVVEENIELQDKYSGHWYRKVGLRRELARSLKMQRSYFLQVDLVIVNSEKQKRIIHDWDPKIPVNLTINGQDVETYVSYIHKEPKEQAVCFYGSLSNQFNRRALMRIINSIYPKIKANIPTLKLYVIGANPPKEHLGQISDDSIIVTGFVDDIKPFLSRCALMLLPLDTSSGFRGRAVEVMALGIPIIGTLNGLQSLGFIDRKHGYIEETDLGIANRAIELLKDPQLLMSMSENCRAYARSNFSLDASFGKLSHDLKSLALPQRLQNKPVN